MYTPLAGRHPRVPPSSRQTPPPEMATAADSTHPTGMHSVYCFIISNDRSFCCLITYMDTIYNTILFIDTSAMLDTTELISQLESHIWW